MILDEIREALRAAGLERLAEVAKRLTLPAIRIEPTMVDEDTIPLGASKLGGRPDLPPDMAWPERDGKPLGFLAQFNLAEVAPYDVEKALPPSGMLYFFYAFAAAPWGLYAEDRGKWIVQYSSLELQTFRRVEWPESLSSLYHLPASQPMFSVTMTLTAEPEWDAHLAISDNDPERFQTAIEPLWQADIKNAATDSAMDDLDEDADEDIEDEEDDEASEDEYEVRATRHQLLGYPLLVHTGEMPWECEMVSSGDRTHSTAI
jgi:uncharacterized protein YwqG